MKRKPPDIRGFLFDAKDGQVLIDLAATDSRYAPVHETITPHEGRQLMYRLAGAIILADQQQQDGAR